MSKRVISSLGLLLLTASFCAVLPTRGQNRNQQPVDLPEGDGKAEVQSDCAICHALTQVTNSGHDHDEWETVLHMMVNVGAPVTEDQFGTVLDYLTKNFPPKPQPEAQIIPGSADVTIKEWMVPTPGSRPHDPMLAAGRVGLVFGAVGQRAGTFRSEDRTVQGVQAAAEVRATRAAGGQGRLHLVHGEFRGLYRETRSQDRRRDEISHARPESSRPAYADPGWPWAYFFHGAGAATWWEGWT